MTPVTIVELMKMLRERYGDRTPPLHRVRIALAEGKLEGERRGREWKVTSDLDEVARVMRIAGPDEYQVDVASRLQRRPHGVR
jgi:hypothetical protein